MNDKNENEHVISESELEDLLKDTFTTREEKTVPEVVVSKALPSVVVDEVTKSEVIEADFSDAKKTLKKMSDNLIDSLDTFITIAEDSQHPKAVEAVATLAKAIADIQKDIVDLHLKKSKLDKTDQKKEGAVEPSTVTNNTMIIASTSSELSKQIKQIIDNGKKV